MPTDSTPPPADAPPDGLCVAVSAPEVAGEGLGVQVSAGAAGGRMAAPQDWLRLGVSIRAERERRGLSRRRLAELAGVSPGSVQSAENGVVPKGRWPQSLGAIEKALDWAPGTAKAALSGSVTACGPTLADHMGRPLYEAINAALAQGQAAERLLARIQQWADGPCPTRPASHPIEGDRASGYVQAMDEIGQLLAGHGPLALDAP